MRAKFPEVSVKAAFPFMVRNAMLCALPRIVRVSVEVALPFVGEVIVTIGPWISLLASKSPYPKSIVHKSTITNLFIPHVPQRLVQAYLNPFQAHHAVLHRRLGL